MNWTFAEDVTSALSRTQCEWLAKRALGRVVLEVGSEFGRSTIALASTANLVVAVDWHRGDDMSGWKDSLPQFMDNLRRYHVLDRVVPMVGRWDICAHLLRRSTFDFAFIDAAHDEQSVYEDGLMAHGLIRAGTVAFHDVDQPQVRAALVRLIERNLYVPLEEVETMGHLRAC